MAISIIGNLPDVKIEAAGTIRGRVFQDYNGNATFDTSGTIDSLFSGVTVTVYDLSGAARGTATTTATADVNGNNFSFAATGTGPYRVEFTNIPTYLKPGVFGAGAGTTVQFVPDGGATNVNLALTDPGKFNNEANPETATTLFVNGQYNAGAVSGLTSLMRTPYNATGHDFTGTTPTAGFQGVELAEIQETGAVYGMAWQSARNRVYVGSYHKRYSGFGANGPDAIYVFDKAGATIGTIDLDTLTGTANSAGADVHDFTPQGGIIYDIGTGNTSYDGVGKRSFGDVDMSADQKTLFVVNLFDRKIYAINVASGTPSGATLIKSWNAPDATSASRHRPFALALHQGKLWVGSVDQNGANAYIHSMTPDLTTSTGNEPFTLETTVPLNYVRQSYQGSAADNPARIATWRTWSTDPATTTYLAAGSEIANPQPMLTDIEFDETNSMVLGFRDRFGDQTGSNLRFRPADTANTWGVSAGDILRVCKTATAFAVEGSAGCPTSGGLANSGPGGATSPEHYNWDLYEDGATWDSTLNSGGGFHWETAQGGLSQVAGKSTILTTAMDPIDDYSGGYLRLTNSTGRREGINTDGATPLATITANGGYSLYDAGTFSGGTPPAASTFFGKSNGLGDIEALTNPPPIEIGNRVWRDADNNGRQDPNEAVLANVLVGLYNSSGTLFSTVETNANGQYLFSSSTTATDVNADTDATPEYDYGLSISPETNYTVAVLSSNFDTGGALVGLAATTANSATAGGVSSNDAIADVRDSDGVILGSAVGTGANAANLGATFTTGTTGATNHSFDFGFFVSASLSDTVFSDVDRDGVQDSGEPGINGVTVTLYASDCTTVISTATTATVSTIAGQYAFDGLAPGTYCVGFTLPTGFGYAFTPANSTSAGGNDTTDSDADPTTGKTGIYTLAAGDNNTTVDAGLVQNMSLGNQVFNDVNGDGVRNGSEVGLGGVTVRLYLDANDDGVPDGAAIATTTTSTTGTVGMYLFPNLAPTTYIVAVVTPSNYTSSSVNGGDPDNNIDNNDNGVVTAAPETRSNPVTLSLAAEPLTENPDNDLNTPDANENLTVDFGFVASVATVVQLDKFDAYTDGNSVELKWSTGNEAGNLGFNVYRETDGKRQLLNVAPIAGSVLRAGAQLAASGSDYVWTVNNAVPNAVYYLEDIDVDGSVNLHGAVTPQFRQTLDNQPNARMFTDLANVGSSEAAREIVGYQSSATPNGKKSAALMKRQQQIAAVGGAKITINRDGWYRVSARQLQAAGFDTNTNPQQWQLYADGAEIPFKLNSDSIEFFGRATDTALTRSQTYYLVNGQTNGLRINAVEGGSAGETADASSFAVTVERRDRAVYVSSLLNGDEDNWFGAVVTRNNETVQNLNAFNVDERGQARLSVKLQGIVAGEHVINVKFNDRQLGKVEFSGFENKQFEFDLPAQSVHEGVNGVSLQSDGGGNDASLVDTIRLGYLRGYTAKDNQIRFIVPANQTVRGGGFTDENISVYEISGATARQQLVGSIEKVAGGYGFSLGAANAEREMIAVVDSTIGQATVVKNSASMWNNPANQADFVIVTSDELRQSADRLAAMRQAQGLQTRVVLVEDLFDEFSFGKPDPNAVREFLRTAATGWQTKPSYALLFGDSSYDSRNNLGLNVTRDLVPTKLVDTEYMETSSDAWLADFDGDGAEDIALGRLPVGNEREAAAAVEKLLRFDNQTARREKTSLLIADRGFETHSQTLQTLLPSNVNSFRVDRSQGSDAETHRNIVDQLNRNPLLVTYTGHGSQNVWATAGIFNSSDAAGLTNDHLSFYLLMNCLNGYTNQPTGESLAEALVKAPNGAIAVWTSSGITQPDGQAAISQAFTSLAFNAKVRRSVRVGDVVKAAKRATDDTDVRRTWQLVGDPTVFIK